MAEWDDIIFGVTQLRAAIACPVVQPEEWNSILESYGPAWGDRIARTFGMENRAELTTAIHAGNITGKQLANALERMLYAY